jgi:dipeptidyl aminopeptidase/acylaminoacyl peptidase
LCQLIPDQRAELGAEVMAEAISPTRLTDAPSAVDRDLIEFYLRSQAELIHAESGERQKLGPQAILESISPAPNGQYFLARRAAPAYTALGAIEGWDRVVEVWDRGGELASTLSRTADGDTAAPRAASWRATAPATIVWVDRHAGQERLLAMAAPFDAPATEIYRTQHRYAGLAWLENSSLALVSEFDPGHRITRAWLVDSENPEEPVRRLGSRSVDAAFPALGRLMTRANDSGKSVARVLDGAIFIIARSGENSYIERIELDSMQSEIIWESNGAGYERVVDVVTPDGDLLLTRFESASEPPNYRMHDLRTGSKWSLTSRRHPAPELTDAQRTALRYQRADGVELSANLYLPAGVTAETPLPLIIWAYPRQYGQGSNAVLGGGPERFPDLERAFKLSFVLSGYAVLDEVSMPVVGSTESANDSFLEQIVANAQAAISAAVSTGYVDPTRVGVAGHSYGGFMVVNLLAHTRLFAAGVAMSGSYNRTLTPFGFQTERRTLWEARDTYLAMSPILYSDQIRSPLLLVHGVLDDNSGTPPIQSQYLYEAIRHNGGEAQLLLLPFEGHTYRARDSVFLTANTMLDWFDKHLRPSEIAEEAMAAVAGRAPIEF